MNHPLKVYYPYGGVHQLLQWWTHDEQHQIVLARTSETMDVVVKRIIVNQGTNKTYERDIEFKTLLEIDIVAPPAIRCAKAIELQHLKDVDDLVNEVCWTLSSKLKKTGLPLPTPFILCPNASEDEYHFECEYDSEGKLQPEHCVSGIKLTITREEFYNRYQEAWYQQNPKRVWTPSPGHPQEVFSRAEQASDDEPLWIASPDFGHHSHGVWLGELDPKEFSIKSALFYFRKLRELDLTPFQKLLKENERAHQEIEEARKIRRKKELNLEDQQEIEKIYSVFPSKVK